MMVKEWDKVNEFNSFNSWKGLLYQDWYKGVRDGKFLPPISAAVDPIHRCNLMCDHCNANQYLGTLEMDRMPDEHMLNIIRFLHKWGVKSICFGGGGEPTLHTNLGRTIGLAYSLGIETSISTNGTMFTEELMDIVVNCCRFVGISVDAATPETYLKGRKKQMFDTVTKNITSLAERNQGYCDIGYKFLIFDYNQHEIFDACVKAFELGAKDFHARPADYNHQGRKIKKPVEYNIPLIMEQFEKCHKFGEMYGIRVFTVMHKFDAEFKPKGDFSQCYAQPLVITLCADGNIYFCVDTRINPFYKMGTHYPDPENILNVWGSVKHKELVYKTGKSNCTSRCTCGPYCRQCEELFIKNKDPFFWKFA